tara:strand:+ start:1052 stop:2395 length:1344 start_codon:yes stop_codon:yes gene_type:complete
VSLNLKQIQAQKQKLAPKQIIQAKILQLNSINLDQAITKELEVNPMLEQVEVENLQTHDQIDESVKEIDVSSEDMFSDETAYFFQQEKKEMPLPDQKTLLEDLISQLKDTRLNDYEREIAEEILWNTNERGYLDTDLILIADRMDVDLEDIEPILQKIQRLNPKGIGSRSLQECLSIQLEDNSESMPFKIINDYFDDFMNKRYDKIKSRLQCTEQELHDAVEHIQHLNPRPGEGFLDKFQTVVPDLIVRKSGNSWIITTNDGNLPDLRISKDYINFDNEHAYDKNAKKFIQERLNSAEWFIDAIKQRKKTLISVTKSIINFQPEWFYGEIDFLNPLKLQDVAEDIKMDISTISRSTRGKFIDTPYGIFELKYFFTDSIKLKDGSIIGTFVIKKSLEKIIKAENKRHPYNDEILVKKLADIGYELARRTIAKYRDQMGYPVARLRKKI